MAMGTDRWRVGRWAGGSGLTAGVWELLASASPTTRLRPEWAGSEVARLALALRKVALEACSSRSGPLSVWGQCGHRRAGLGWTGQARGGPGSPLPPWGVPYHVVLEALVDGHEERLVGALEVQEVQEGQAPGGGVGIAQQHLGGSGGSGRAAWAQGLPPSPQGPPARHPAPGSEARPQPTP